MNDKPRQSLNVIAPANAKIAELAQQPATVPAAVHEPSSEREALVIEALREVFDPEIPVNVYDLGLIYDIAFPAADRVAIRMTLTAPACPMADKIVADVQKSVMTVPGINSAAIELVWSPAWSRDRMSEAALLELGLL